ncbi:MAG TPA: EamA family transporter RarD [Steroidobacteraceae bacterium]|nr:EamA family transporter RarD [Steroidobacteraceae bacterium]
MPSSTVSHHSHSSAQASTRGGIAAATAFFAWGLWPLFLKPLHEVDTLQVAAWRAVLGCMVGFAWLAWRGELHKARNAIANHAVAVRLIATALLLMVNWSVYIWAIAHHQVVSSSLGYFINPLMNVLLGVLVLSERLNRLQWTAVLLATASVAWLTISTGELPWVALALATSFSLYGLIRKTAAVEALPGSAVETLFMSPLAIVFLIYNQWHFANVLHHRSMEFFMLFLFGPLTTVPSVLFSYGAQRINYATVGMLQYIAPTMQFMLGLFLFHETLSAVRLWCFVVIWIALFIYATDSWLRMRITRKSAIA